MREAPRLMQRHDMDIDFINWGMAGHSLSFLEALSRLDNYPTDFVEYDEYSDDDEEYTSQNSGYCGFPSQFLNRGFSKPMPGLPSRKGIKRITAEEAAKIGQELVDEEERRKEKAEKKRQKKMRQQERRRKEKLEKENAEKAANKQVNPGPVKSKPVDGKCENKNQSDNTVVSSGDDEEEEESVADEQEELDLNSCFVTNAAAIAKRKIEHKLKFERKKPENSKQRRAQQRSAARPENKEEEQEEKEEVNREESEEAGNDVIIKSMELAVMGNAYAQSGNLHMAVRCFNDAVKHNPKEYKLFGNRSFCHEKLQQYEEALRDADIALSLNPTWIKGLYRKGKALVGLKKYYEACLTYKEILKLDSSCTDAAQELMRVQIMWLMEMGFTREQSSNALIIHGTVEKASEALSGIQGSIAAAPMSSEVCVEEEWISLERNPQHHKVPIKAAPQNQNQPGSSSGAKPSSSELFPIWVGHLVPGITSLKIRELFSRIGPVSSIKVLSDKRCAFVNYTNREDCAKAIQEMHGYALAGTCLAVRYPDKIHTHLGVSKTASTDKGKLPDECHFWRTTGCVKNNRCSYKHIPEHRGIDQPKPK
ncbi:uncharacterized protein LOC143476039 isoform X2 [Brachyhypopomus gauderio]